MGNLCSKFDAFGLFWIFRIKNGEDSFWVITKRLRACLLAVCSVDGISIVGSACFYELLSASLGSFRHILAMVQVIDKELRKDVHSIENIRERI